jgi:hypothetical protein
VASLVGGCLYDKSLVAKRCWDRKPEVVMRCWYRRCVHRLDRQRYASACRADNERDLFQQ